MANNLVNIGDHFNKLIKECEVFCEQALKVWEKMIKIKQEHGYGDGKLQFGWSLKIKDGSKEILEIQSDHFADAYTVAQSRLLRDYESRKICEHARKAIEILENLKVLPHAIHFIQNFLVYKLYVDI